MRKYSITSKILALSLALSLSAGLGIGLGAQAVDQAALAQALAAQGSGGAAPTAAPAQPTVNALAAQGTPIGSPATAGTAAATVDAGRSALETMFAGMAAGIGTPGQALEQFGYSLFDKPTTASLAAIGDDYVLGPGDSLVLYLWGDPVDIKEISASYSLSVDRNGFVFLPPAGQIAVWGQDLASVRTVIKSMLDRRYKRLEMNLTLAGLRQFPVFVSGFAGAPGTVLATGADTLLTVLSRAGGIRKTGSLRTVELSRTAKSGSEKLKIDFYDSLINRSSLDLRVREGDSIFVPGIGPTVALSGELRRPGIYELKGETSIAVAMELAGGVLPSARSGAVSLLKFSEAGRTLASGDLASAGFTSRAAADGDLIHVGKASELLVGQVQLSGAAKYPGRYDAANFSTLYALLNKTQPLPDTNLFYGRVYRMDSSGRDKSFVFSPKDVLAGADIALAEFDRVVLYRYDDVGIDPDFDRFADSVVVSGPVKYPGFYMYRGGLSLAQLMADNALTLDANPYYAEITRKGAAGIDEYYTFSPEEILSGAKDISLARFDRLRFVRRGADVVAHNFNRFPAAVSLTGQVARPEVFALREGMKLSSLLTKDQLLLDTNLNYAEITRLRADGKNEYLTFRPSEVLEGSWDLELGAADKIRLVQVGYAPGAVDFDRFKDAVRISGPGQFTGLYAWREGMKLSSLLAKAKPSLLVNQVYAEIVRPLGGDAYEYLTFSPKEVASGIFDLTLAARDSVRLYSTLPATAAKQGAGTETAGKEPAPITSGEVQTAGSADTPAAAVAVPAEASGTLVQSSAPVAAAAPGGAPAPVPTAVEGSFTAEASVAEQQSWDFSADLSRFLEVVRVSGAVRYTGPWARTPSLKLSSVIRADQMLEETNLEYAELTRLNEDGSYEYRTFAPEDVLEKKFDLALRARDSIRLVRKTPFGGAPAATDMQKFAAAVQLVGQVARPEVFALREGMKLSAMLTADQLLLDTNLAYAEITRFRTDGKNEYHTFRPSEVLNGSWDYTLGPRDVVRLHKVAYAPEKHDFDRFANAVQLYGPVRFPGLYAWREGMKLSSLLESARPALETNQFYAEIVRPLGGTAFEYITFAPREIASKKADLTLRPRDVVRLYTTIPTTANKLSTESQGTSAETVKIEAAAAPAAAPVPAPRASEVVAAGVAPTTAPAGEAAARQVTAAPAPAATAMAAPVPNAVAAPNANILSVGDIAAETGMRFFEVVTVSGTVRYVGPYARTEGLKLSSILTKDQLLEETNLEYAELTRLKEDGTAEYIAISPRAVLDGSFDLELKARDSIRLVPKTGFKGAKALADLDRFVNVVQLTGQAARPEIFAHREGMNLSAIVKSDQILLDTNLNYAEITRVRQDGKNEYITFRPLEVLNGSWDFTLGPRDVVRLHKVAYAPEKPDFDRFTDAVLIRGPVQFPGLYAWKEGMKLSTLQKQASIILDTNQVYADIMRPLPGGKSQLITFAPREVAAGIFDLELMPKDTLQFYSMAAIEEAKRKARETQIVQAPAGESGLIAGSTLGEAATASPGIPATAAAPYTGIVQTGAAAVSDIGTVGAAGSVSVATENQGFYVEIVNVSGPVAYEGPYARTPSLKLSSVVTADQMLSSTNLDYAELSRRKADGAWEYLSFSPRKVLTGDFDLNLRAQDHIRFVELGYMHEKPDFDRFGNAYALLGAVRSPGLYSMNESLSLSDVVTVEQLLGATDIHYAEIERWVPGGRTEYLTFSPLAVLLGEQNFKIFPRDLVKLRASEASVTEHDFTRYPNAVLISGVVRYQRRYAWYEGLSLADLISADDMLIDTNIEYAELRRRGFSDEAVNSFSPRALVEGAFDIELQPRDMVVFYPKYFNKPVTIAGAVQENKVIPYYEGLELSTVLRSVILGKDIDNLKAVITKSSGERQTVYLENYYRKQSASKVILNPGDSVAIEDLLPEENLPVVTVRGAVKNPQTLAYREGMKLMDALQATGGYDARAYPYGLVLIRKTAAETQQKQVDRLIAQLEAASAAGAALPASTDSSLSSAAAVVANLQIDLAVQRAKLGSLRQLYKEGFGRISLEIPETLDALASSSSNIMLERDDLIFVPTTPSYVMVSGQVADQNVVVFREGMTVRQALAESGWISAEADMAKAYIVRASGRLDSPEGKRGFLWFKPTILKYSLRPGDTVVVPSKAVKVSVAWSYIKDGLSVVSTILTSALTAVTLLGL